ncbi:hypothetical protein GW17_00033949, partial [Ensete ventricosum]
MVPRSSSVMLIPDDVVRGVHLILVIVQLRYRLRQVDGRAMASCSATSIVSLKASNPMASLAPRSVPSFESPSPPEGLPRPVIF